jgi:hypothetical protein
MHHEQQTQLGDINDKAWIFEAYAEVTSDPEFDWQHEQLGPKMLILRTLLIGSKRCGDKVIVFSKWSQCLSLLESYMKKWNFSCGRIDGELSLDARQEVIDQFQTNKELHVLLISTFCGEGINLTAGNRVVIFEPGWNPSSDYQAALRAHRYGQTKPVFIYRLVCNETVDACVFVRQLSKVELSKWAVDNLKTFSSVCEDPTWKKYLSKPEMLKMDAQVDLSKVAKEDSINVSLVKLFGVAKGGSRGFITTITEERFLFSTDSDAYSYDSSINHEISDLQGEAESFDPEIQGNPKDLQEETESIDPEIRGKPFPDTPIAHVSFQKLEEGQDQSNDVSDVLEQGDHQVGPNTRIPENPVILSDEQGDYFYSDGDNEDDFDLDSQGKLDISENLYSKVQHSITEDEEVISIPFTLPSPIMAASITVTRRSSDDKKDHELLQKLSKNLAKISRKQQAAKRASTTPEFVSRERQSSGITEQEFDLDDYAIGNDLFEQRDPYPRSNGFKRSGSYHQDSLARSDGIESRSRKREAHHNRVAEHSPIQKRRRFHSGTDFNEDAKQFVEDGRDSERNIRSCKISFSSLKLKFFVSSSCFC